MSRPRRSAPRRAGARRARAQAEAAGNEIRAARGEMSLTRAAASRRAGVSPDTERRVENGDPSVGVATICAVGEAVGVDIVIRSYRSRGPSLRDSGQLRLAEIICEIAHPSLKAALELPAGDHGEACDIGFFGPTEIIDVEIDRMITAFEGQHRRNVLKRDHLAARHERPVRLVMVVEDTVRNRAAMAPHMEFIRTALPAGSRELLRSLRSGEPLGRDGLLWIRPRKPPARR